MSNPIGFFENYAALCKEYGMHVTSDRNHEAVVEQKPSADDIEEHLKGLEESLASTPL